MAEAKLGIPAGEGMAIKYERKTENIAGILGIVLVVGLLALLFAGGRNLRSRYFRNCFKVETKNLFRVRSVLICYFFISFAIKALE